MSFNGLYAKRPYHLVLYMQSVRMSFNGLYAKRPYYLSALYAEGPYHVLFICSVLSMYSLYTRSVFGTVDIGLCIHGDPASMCHVCTLKSFVLAETLELDRRRKP